MIIKERSVAAPRFMVGDMVDVLSAVRLPQEHVLHSGTVERTDGDLCWISGLICARSANVLRLIQRAR